MIVISTSDPLNTHVVLGDPGEIVVLDNTGTITYSYNLDSLCRIVSIREDGSVDIRVFEDEDGGACNKYIPGVDPRLLEISGDYDDEPIDDEEDVTLDGDEDW